MAKKKIMNTPALNVHSTQLLKTKTIYVVLEAYYKHGECGMTVFQDENAGNAGNAGDKMIEYMRLNYLDDYFMNENIDDHPTNVADWIELALEIGERRINEQIGWGIKEVKVIQVGL